MYGVVDMRTKKSIDHVWERRRKSHRGAPKRLQHTPINILTSFGGGKQITKHKRRPNAFIHYFVDTFWSTEISQFSKKKILRRGPSPTEIGLIVVDDVAVLFLEAVAVCRNERVVLPDSQHVVQRRLPLGPAGRTHQAGRTLLLYLPESVKFSTLAIFVV